MKNLDYQDIVKVKRLLKSFRISFGVKETFGVDVLQTGFFWNGEQFEIVDWKNRRILLELWGDTLVFMRYVNEDQLEVVQIDSNLDKSEFCVIRDTLEVRLGGLVFTELWKKFDFVEGRFELVGIDEKEFVLSRKLIRDRLVGLDLNVDSLRKIYSQIFDYLLVNTNMVSYQNRFQVGIDGDQGILAVIFNGEDITSVYENMRGSSLVKRIYDLYHGKITKDNERDMYLIHLTRLKDTVFGLRELRGVPLEIDRLIGKSFGDVSIESFERVNVFLREHFGTICQEDFNRENILACIGNVCDIREEFSNLEMDGKKIKDKNIGEKKKLFRSKKKNLNLKN